MSRQGHLDSRRVSSSWPRFRAFPRHPLLEEAGWPALAAGRDSFLRAPSVPVREHRWDCCKEVLQPVERTPTVPAADSGCEILEWIRLCWWWCGRAVANEQPDAERQCADHAQSDRAQQPRGLCAQQAGLLRFWRLVLTPRRGRGVGDLLCVAMVSRPGRHKFRCFTRSRVESRLRRYGPTLATTFGSSTTEGRRDPETHTPF